ncbi:hypothetical protein BGX23_006345 [Mortierella sp. AD031]|nr:hypothetical protein BGX23_006345 [Mortierella sp. AD031]
MGDSAICLRIEPRSIRYQHGKVLEVVGVEDLTSHPPASAPAALRALQTAESEELDESVYALSFAESSEVDWSVYAPSIYSEDTTITNPFRPLVVPTEADTTSVWSESDEDESDNSGNNEHNKVKVAAPAPPVPVAKVTNKMEFGSEILFNGTDSSDQLRKSVEKYSMYSGNILEGPPHSQHSSVNTARPGNPPSDSYGVPKPGFRSMGIREVHSPSFNDLCNATRPGNPPSDSCDNPDPRH